MLSDERIEDIWFRVGGYASALDDSDLRMFRAIECETTAPLIEQIKEDESLMRQVLKALPSALPCGEFHHKAKDRHGIGEPCRPAGLYVEAVYMLSQRLEAKK